MPYSPLWELQHLMPAAAKVFLLCFSSPNAKVSPSPKVQCVTAGGRVRTGMAVSWEGDSKGMGCKEWGLLQARPARLADLPGRV